MKTKHLLILLTFAFSFSSCKKKITQFHMDYDSTVIVSSSVGALIPISVLSPEIISNSSVEFENNDTKSDRINSIFLKELTLTITSPDSETFSFLNSLEIYISSTNQTEKKVAFKNNIPETVGDTIFCDLVDLDLQTFIKDEQFKIRLVSVTDETIPNDVYINVYTDFLVDAKLKK